MNKLKGYLEKPVSLAFRGTLRDLSIGGRVNNQRLTLQLIMSLPPNPHPVEVFRCALKTALTYLIYISVLPLLVACATSPTGRTQLTLVSDVELKTIGIRTFEDIKSKKTIVKNKRIINYVNCIVEPIIREVNTITNAKSHWEVRIFADNTPNAFALPGQKIGIHTGIINPDITNNQHQLATVIGHEIAHLLANHSNERISHGILADIGLNAASQALRKSGATHSDLMLAGLGVGAQYGILLPFSRKHESEADIYGLQLMARAGFDPRESVKLWRNMAKSGGKKIPEWLSTHPDHNTRIDDLEKHILTEALWLYRQAQSEGKRPDCRIQSGIF